jgi:hypothetical protein
MMLDGHTDYREPISSSLEEPADLETAVLMGIGPKQIRAKVFPARRI